MKSILNEIDKNKLIERINNLDKDTKPLWGSMSVSQMLKHCTVSVKLAFGEIIPEIDEKILDAGRKYKDKVLETEVFSKNLPTSKEFLVRDDGNFEKNKVMLIDYIKKYSEIDTKNKRDGVHPIFGKLTVNEWGIIIWKHTNHHLLQFGV